MEGWNILFTPPPGLGGKQPLRGLGEIRDEQTKCVEDRARSVIRSTNGRPRSNEVRVRRVQEMNLIALLKLLTMINLDDRIIDKQLLGESEFWLLMHIVKRINRNRKTFPGNDLLCQDTGFSICKLKRVKKKLVSKKMLLVKSRIGVGHKFTSNEYTVNTEYVSIYMPMKEVKTPPIVEPINRPVKPDTVVSKEYHGEGETVVSKEYHGERKTVVSKEYHEVLSNTIEVLMCVSDNSDKGAETHTLETSVNDCPVRQIPPNSAAPPPQILVLFRDTKYVKEPDGLKMFESDMISRSKEFENIDLEYYYHRMLNWSDNGNRRKNWLASASMFIMNDKRDNKLQLKNPNHGNTFAENATINGHSVGKVADYFARISGKNRV